MESRPGPSPSHESAVHYRIAAPRPAERLLEVGLRFTPPGPGTVRLVFPVWTPGSYLVREHERHLQDFRARDHKGAELPWRKSAKNVWEVETGSGGPVSLSYRLYAAELSVRTSHLDSDHASLEGTATFLCVEGLRERQAVLEIHPPEGWKVATALEPLPGSGLRFGADDYDHLVDCPVEMGDFTESRFEVRGVPHRFVVCGRGNWNARRITEDTAKIVEEAARIFGGLPYPHYTFLCHQVRGGGGGLEHRNSCSIQVDRNAFASGTAYRDLLDLVAHEHFHVWNGKSIHPAAFDRIDYGGECYTSLLWIFEGFTTYYGWLLPMRSGLVAVEAWLDTLARRLTDRARTPGRARMSLAEAGFDAWIKYYRPNEHAPNAQVSYYSEGALAALVLDLEIRRLTEGARSLDTVMAHLEREHGRGRPGLGEDGLPRVLEAVAGTDLEDLHRELAHDRADPDYAARLRWVGLDVVREPPETRETADGKRPAGFLGVTLTRDRDRNVLGRILEGTPAAEAGLQSGDEILAVEGVRLEPSSLRDRISACAPGEPVRLALFRRDVLREVTVTPGADPFPRYRLRAHPEAGEAERERFHSWCGATLPEKEE
jgi:predicted metalloprotease with PDZ domain